MVAMPVEQDLLLDFTGSAPAEDCVGSCQACPSVGSCADRVVCRCFKITEETIILTIRKHGASSVQDLRKATGAGGGCMCCHRQLKGYLAVYAPLEVAPIDYLPASSSPSMCSVR